MSWQERFLSARFFGLVALVAAGIYWVTMGIYFSSLIFVGLGLMYFVVAWHNARTLGREWADVELKRTMWAQYHPYPEEILKEDVFKVANPPMTLPGLSLVNKKGTIGTPAHNEEPSFWPCPHFLDPSDDHLDNECRDQAEFKYFSEGQIHAIAARSVLFTEADLRQVIKIGTLKGDYRFAAIVSTVPIEKEQVDIRKHALGHLYQPGEDQQDGREGYCTSVHPEWKDFRCTRMPGHSSALRHGYAGVFWD